MNLHLNLTQDIGHGITVIFICCVLVIVACFIDLWTGIDAARKNKEKIRSKALRRTVSKILDYLRVIIFGVLIDVLGLTFPWYAIPYCAIVCTLGTLVIEGKSVLENFQKKKSSAAKVAEMAEKIVECLDNETAEKIIKAIKSDSVNHKQKSNEQHTNR
jgi:phage-related holin